MAAGDDPLAHTRAYTSGGPGATAAEGAEANEPGGRRGRYRLERRLGAGGMGVVFAAHDPELERTVALKVLRGPVPALVGTPGTAQSRLLREAQAMARLQHPNVVAIHDVGQVDGQVFVAAEYVDGWNVRQWLALGARGWREVVRVYLEAGKGLAAAHAASLVHRDFKPDNVLVARDGRVRVTDFGLALTLSTDDRPASAMTTAMTMTGGGPVAGTPAYMSPEQRTGGVVDARSDQFSFAAALREGLPRRAPRRIRRVLARALASDPDLRYPTLPALLADLERRARFRWRGWLVAGTALIAAAGVWPTVRLSRARALSACTGAAAALASAWGPQRRDAVRAAFRRTRLPYAEASAAAVERRVTAELSTWQQARQDACASTHVRRVQPAEVLALRLGCLDEHLSDLGAVADTFSRADAALVQASADVMTTIAPLAACDDVRALALRPAAPGGVGARARQAPLRERLVRVSALGKAARYQEGLDLVTPVITGARALGDTVLEADAQLREGQLRFGAGEHARAERVLLEAMAAGEASRHEEVRVRAATALAELLAQQGHGDRARGFVKLARAALGRLAPRPDLEGGVLFVEARLQGDDADAAIALVRRAVARFEAGTGGESNEVAVAENLLGWLLATRGEHEAALPHLRRAVATTRTIRGALHPNLSIALGNLASALRASGRHGEIVPVLQEQLAVVAANHDPLPAGAGLVHAQLAAAHWVLGQQPAGRREADQALALLRQSVGERHPDFAIAMLTSGAVSLADGRYRQARAEFARSLAVLEAAAAGPSALTDPLLGLGVAHLGEGRPAQAIAPLERALALAVPGGARPQGRALIQAMLGRALLESGRHPARGRRLLAEARPALSPGGRVQLAGYPAALAGELEAYYQAHPELAAR
jgi:eukaryotic-like serine/threonine-protein kinase